MHGHINKVREQRFLNRLREYAESAHAGKRTILNLVAVGFDDDKFDWPRVEYGPQTIGDVIRLP